MLLEVIAVHGCATDSGETLIGVYLSTDSLRKHIMYSFLYVKRNYGDIVVNCKEFLKSMWHLNFFN